MNESAAPRFDALLAIKVAPPRPRRGWLRRQRLLERYAEMRERPLLLVQAPPGFGKTGLLAGLRRECLARGAYVAWLTLDAGDDAARFTEGLLLSLAATLRNSDELNALRRETAAGAAPFEILGRLLSLLAELAQPVALVFDDAHALPESVAAELLPYIVLNLPPNAQVLIGSRHALPGLTQDLLRRGELTQLGQAELRFRLEESLELLRTRFGAAVDVDTGARVHEAVDGWPLGLQLAISIAERNDAPAAALARMGEHTVDLRLHAAEVMLATLDPATQDFLLAVAPLERLHPELCALLTGRADAAALLARLQEQTPILLAVEGQEWSRLHAVVRHALRARFDALPEARRQSLHWQAAQWLQQRELLDEAAAHALAAARDASAYDWIARGLHDMVLGARFAPALHLLDSLPAEALAQRAELGLAAAIANTLTYRHELARHQLEALAGTALSAAQCFELAQVRGALAHYADDYATLAEIAATVGAVPEETSPAIRAAHLNLVAGLALHRGNTAAARFELRRHEWPAPGQALDYGQCYAQFFRAYTEWLDGRVFEAESHLAPQRAAIEARFGRRSAPASLHAALHAAVLWDRDQTDEAELILADRLDIVERTGSPTAIALAYRTLIRAAGRREARARSDELVGNLSELGARRELPRLVLIALDEQLRAETAAGRRSAALATLERMQRFRQDTALLDRHDLATRSDLGLALALARTALAQGDADSAAAALSNARRLMGPTWPWRERLECQVLDLVLAQHRRQPPPESEAALRERATELGWARLFADSWPAWGAAPVASATSAPVAPARVPQAALHSVLLTDKEREVLSMLARNYTNKEIARALDIGDETAKWHVKNISGKLNAGGRRHAVERARLLGLLVTD